MDLELVNVLARDNNGVNYLLVCQDLFDWTVQAKKVKAKVPKKRFKHFQIRIRKKPPQWSFGQQGTEIAEEFFDFATLEQINFTVRWVRLKLHLLNGQYDQ